MSNEWLAVLICCAAAWFGPAIGAPWLILVAFFLIGPWLLGRRERLIGGSEKPEPTRAGVKLRPDTGHETHDADGESGWTEADEAERQLSHAGLERGAVRVERAVTMGLMEDKARLDSAFARLQKAGLLTWSEADQEVTWDPWFQRAYVTEGAPPIRTALQQLGDRDAQDLLLYLISKERRVPLDAMTAQFTGVLKPR